MQFLKVMLSYRNYIIALETSGASDTRTEALAGRQGSPIIGRPISDVSLAIEFFKDVTKTTSMFQTAPNVTIIDHSFRGGLAGFISALSGMPGVGFDYMPFGLDELTFTL